MKYRVLFAKEWYDRLLMTDINSLPARLAGFLGHHIRNATSSLQSYLECVKYQASSLDDGLVVRNISFLRSVGEFLAKPDNKLFVADGTRPTFTTPTIPQEDLGHNSEAASITIGDLTERLSEQFNLPQFTIDLSSKIDSMEAKLARKDLDSVTEFTDWFDATIKSLD